MAKEKNKHKTPTPGILEILGYGASAAALGYVGKEAWSIHKDIQTKGKAAEAIVDKAKDAPSTLRRASRGKLQSLEAIGGGSKFTQALETRTQQFDTLEQLRGFINSKDSKKIGLLAGEQESFLQAIKEWTGSLTSPGRYSSASFSMTQYTNGGEHLGYNMSILSGNDVFNLGMLQENGILRSTKRQNSHSFVGSFVSGDGLSGIMKSQTAAEATPYIKGYNTTFARLLSEAGTDKKKIAMVHRLMRENSHAVNSLSGSDLGKFRSRVTPLATDFNGQFGKMSSAGGYAHENTAFLEKVFSLFGSKAAAMRKDSEFNYGTFTNPTTLLDADNKSLYDINPLAIGNKSFQGDFKNAVTGIDTSVFGDSPGIDYHGTNYKGKYAQLTAGDNGQFVKKLSGDKNKTSWINTVLSSHDINGGMYIPELRDTTSIQFGNIAHSLRGELTSATVDLSNGAYDLAGFAKLKDRAVLTHLREIKGKGYAQYQKVFDSEAIAALMDSYTTKDGKPTTRGFNEGVDQFLAGMDSGTRKLHDDFVTSYWDKELIGNDGSAKELNKLFRDHRVEVTGLNLGNTEYGPANILNRESGGIRVYATEASLGYSHVGADGKTIAHPMFSLRGLAQDNSAPKWWGSHKQIGEGVISDKMAFNASMEAHSTLDAMQYVSTHVDPSRASEMYNKLEPVIKTSHGNLLKRHRAINSVITEYTKGLNGFKDGLGYDYFREQIYNTWGGRGNLKKMFKTGGVLTVDSIRNMEPSLIEDGLDRLKTALYHSHSGNQKISDKLRGIDADFKIDLSTPSTALESKGNLIEKLSGALGINSSSAHNLVSGYLPEPTDASGIMITTRQDRGAAAHTMGHGAGYINAAQDFLDRAKYHGYNALHETLSSKIFNENFAERAHYTDLLRSSLDGSVDLSKDLALRAQYLTSGDLDKIYNAPGMSGRLSAIQEVARSQYTGMGEEIPENVKNVIDNMNDRTRVFMQLDEEVTLDILGHSKMNTKYLGMPTMESDRFIGPSRQALEDGAQAISVDKTLTKNVHRFINSDQKGEAALSYTQNILDVAMDQHAFSGTQVAGAQFQVNSTRLGEDFNSHLRSGPAYNGMSTEQANEKIGAIANEWGFAPDANTRTRTGGVSNSEFETLAKNEKLINPDFQHTPKSKITMYGWRAPGDVEGVSVYNATAYLKAQMKGAGFNDEVASRSANQFIKGNEIYMSQKALEVTTSDFDGDPMAMMHAPDAASREELEEGLKSRSAYHEHIQSGRGKSIKGQTEFKGIGDAVQKYADIMTDDIPKSRALKVAKEAISFQTGVGRISNKLSAMSGYDMPGENIVKTVDSAAGGKLTFNMQSDFANVFTVLREQNIQAKGNVAADLSAFEGFMDILDGKNGLTGEKRRQALFKHMEGMEMQRFNTHHGLTDAFRNSGIIGEDQHFNTQDWNMYRTVDGKEEATSELSQASYVGRKAHKDERIANNYLNAYTPEHLDAAFERGDNISSATRAEKSSAKSLGEFANISEGGSRGSTSTSSADNISGVISQGRSKQKRFITAAGDTSESLMKTLMKNKTVRYVGGAMLGLSLLRPLISGPAQQSVREESKDAHKRNTPMGAAAISPVSTGEVYKAPPQGYHFSVRGSLPRNTSAHSFQTHMNNMGIPFGGSVISRDPAIDAGYVNSIQHESNSSMWNNG